ncbi:MAG: hypothetical protein CL607_05040 [Anaerolineaceae bacterium]|nr:hypothetical protein [Anaerolineaceae bacterium]
MTPKYPYDLRTGYPNTEILVPHEKLAAIAQDLLLTDRATQYGGILQGPLMPREQIAKWLTANATQPATPEQLVITSGAIAATDLVCRTVTEPGDIVVVEDPTFYYMINILKMSNIEVVGVPMTPQGMDLEALAGVVEQYGERLKLVYSIPSYHNPTGVNASPENRKKLVELAQQNNFTVLEDTTYQWLYFDSPPPPLCRHYDNGSGHVVSVGSFSKTLMPSLRLGWIWAADEAHAQSFTKFKGDSVASTLTSGMVGEFIAQGQYDTQLEYARNHYAERCGVLVEALQKVMLDYVQWDVPQGGYFVWMTLPEHIKAQDVLELSQARGADFMPGRLAYVDGADDRYMRVCFTMMDDEKLQTGAQIIAESIEAVAAR